MAAPVPKDYASFNKHSTGFGSKYLEKFGFKTGVRDPIAQLAGCVCVGGRGSCPARLSTARVVVFLARLWR
jgi:hypothetical protein